jgi:glutamate dehydrogenase (NADP+)
LPKKEAFGLIQTMNPHSYVQYVLEVLKQRNGGSPLFFQAAEEILHSLIPVFEANNQFKQAGLLERICEPERQIVFRVVWQDDTGKTQVNRGFRVQFNSALGPYKGGIRFHSTVDIDTIKFLAFEQIFKNSLTGLQMGGGKGGSDFNPKGRSDNEIMRFCQSFMTELFRHIGDKNDVPAGDIGVGGREIGYMFGQYKRLVNRFEGGVLTGKDVRWGGSLARKEATGYGCVYFAQEMLSTRGDSLRGKKCVVSGSGNVAIYAMEKLIQSGAIPVACSDSDGYIYDAGGIDLVLVKELKEVKRARISEYLKTRKNAQYKAGGTIWDVPCDAAFPCATQNELSAESAKTLIANGCKLVSEGANMPTERAGVIIFQKSNVLFGPGKAANAGGVAVSGLEMQQNASWAHWSFDEVDARLRNIIHSIHSRALECAQEYGCPGDYVAGANIGGFLRLAEAMMAYGLV